jgi:gliding motility-associated-like protein
MSQVFKYLLFFMPFCVFSQNVITDSQTFTPQQLIEDILIDSNCIENVVVTNAVSGDFGDSEKSYGYFDATGTGFPFQTGIVLSTGRLSNVQGPNDNLSDDDGNNWTGDNDLEVALQETNTLNATILEFDFTSIANEISFRYIFASEEYQENNANTCNFSDLFGFLIRPINSSTYQNIALVPGTNTPVKVTTVHPEIPNGCAAQNEIYFDTFNPSTAPINFNGQTEILTATATTIPNQTYHVKLVIADEQNYRYDSAVFLEAGSFKLSSNLGPDRLLANRTALCGTETLQLDAAQTNAVAYQWFKNGTVIAGAINSTYTVVDAGVYSVEVTLNNTCISEGEITVEYANLPVVNSITVFECDANQDGLTTYNLYSFEGDIITDQADSIIDFYLSSADAENEIDEITNPNNFSNSTPNQVVYALVSNQITGCSSIASLTLSTSNNTLNISDLEICEDDVIDGFTSFDLNDITADIQPQIPANATVRFFPTEPDALNNSNQLNQNFTNTTPFTQTIFVKVTDNTNNCFAISPANLVVLERPEVAANYTTSYCETNFPDTITLTGEVINPQTTYTYQWYLDNNPLNETGTTISINMSGIYTFQVTNTNQCVATQTITVNPINAPVISLVDFTELTENNTVTINLETNGNFEFALDNPNLLFQDSNVFTNVSPGVHIAYVREKNGCGFAEQTIYILGFPQFFTPNGDGFNDYWKPLGISKTSNIDLNIKVFNRYGKLLKQIEPFGLGWDGTFNSNPMPTDDYWFLISRKNGTTYTGHFTLKR